MRFFRRSLFALAVAAMLPTVVFAAVGIFYFLRAERQQVEAAVLGRAQTVSTLIDAQLRGDLATLRVLSTSIYFQSEDWAEFYMRLRRVQEQTPHWATIVLYDVAQGAEIFDLRRSFGAPRIAALPGDTSIAALDQVTDLTGGIQREPEPLVHIYMPVRSAGRLHHILIAGLRPQMFQDILTAQAGDTIAAVVDRRGNFVARTRDFAARVGTPATTYVRAAIRSAHDGIYAGTTYEGLENYTAFRTSSLSGWSAHIAIDSSLIDRPTAWSFTVAVIAGLGTAVLAAVLTVLVLRDMAERRRAEEALRQSQKMEAVGQLTGGIAHDFNNLLTAIIGNLDMIRTRIGRGDGPDQNRLQRLAENALEAARRGARLTAQLLAFSRSQRLQRMNVDLVPLLNGMSGLLAQSVGPAIGVHISIDPDARYVSSDANQLELALLNLAVNARDAMPEGGSLTISVQRAQGLDLKDLPARDYVEVRVSDTGTGMPEEVRARAMEPFYTTKAVGHGTGLGLSQVYGIVRESQGTVILESTVNAGTTVRLILPAAAGAPNPAVRDTPTAVSSITAARDTSIVVVDDDDHVRNFMTVALQGLGYKVAAHASGATALDSLRESRVDLLVVDFAMPAMNGAEVGLAAQRIQPDLKVLVVSGYSDTEKLANTLGEAHLLRKPFDIDELGVAVAEVLKA